MKKKALSVVAALLTVATLISGCATAGGGSYQMKQTRQDVDWAMVHYHNRQAFGLLTPQEEQGVAEAFKAYQSAFDAAAKAVNGNYETPTPANVKQLADQLLSILSSIP
jgi:hypothetical protein